MFPPPKKSVEWEKEFDKEFRFNSAELARDCNREGTELRNDLIAFIQNLLDKTRTEAYTQGRLRCLEQNYKQELDWAVEKAEKEAVDLCKRHYNDKIKE